MMALVVPKRKVPAPTARRVGPNRLPPLAATDLVSSLILVLEDVKDHHALSSIFARLAAVQAMC